MLSPNIPIGSYPGRCFVCCSYEQKSSDFSFSGDINLSLNLGVNSSDVLHEVNNTARVAPLIVIPGNKLDEVGVEHDTGISIKDGGDGVALVVSGHKGLIGVSEEALHVTLSLGLDVGADLLVGGGLLQTAGKVNNRHINGGDTEGHAGKLALKGGDDLGHSLGSTSGGGDDVARGSTATTPVLAGGGVNNSLGGGHGVDGGHEGLLNHELVMDGLHHGGKAVGGARGAGDEVLRAIVFSLVDTHDNGLGVILGGGRVDDLLGTAINDGLGLLLGQEHTGGLAHVVSTKGTPPDLLGVTAARGLDLLAIEDKEVAINLNRALGNAVDGVILVLVCHVVGGGRPGVDGVEGAVLVLHHDTGHETANAAETVDTHAGGHGHGGTIAGGLEGGAREGRRGVGGGRANEEGGDGKLHS
mmetsp:Transcript_27631/g.56627  ORF Transcript_27631/g.56627 Transcript_27631/m.56627 type:complete len:414 (+) Transcript_27631:378-1619(+)